MKKTLIAAAVMATSGIAFAASNVTLYGVIEEGVLLEKAKHADTTVQLRSGFDQGSRWGIKGVEDLGNGYSVGFILEQGFSADDGNVANAGNGTTSGFTREAFMYVNGDFGKFGAGRTGTLASGAQSNHILTGWALGTGLGLSSWTSAIGTSFSRTNNSVVYATPVFSGFSVHAMYSNGTEDDANKWSDNRHYYGLGLKYADKAATAALIFEALDGKGTGGEKKLGTGLNTYLKTLGLDLIKGDDLTTMDKRTAEFKDRKTAYSVTAGGTYNFGVVTAMGIYQYAWESEMYSQHAFGLSASAPLAGGTAKLGARYLLGKLDGDAKNVAKALDADTKYRAWNIDAGYTYPLSKRTYFYSFAGYSDGAKLYKDVENGKFNGWSVGTGLVHKF